MLTASTPLSPTPKPFRQWKDTLFFKVICNCQYLPRIKRFIRLLPIFTIHLNNNGYNFKGTPIPNAIVIKQNGITLANNDFVSPSSFNLIHTDSSREDYATVNLYRRSDTEYGEDILIASINSDLNGNPIVLPAGRTTNLLIDLRQEISVHIKTSLWDKTEQWVEW